MGFSIRLRCALVNGHAAVMLSAAPVSRPLHVSGEMDGARGPNIARALDFPSHFD